MTLQDWIQDGIGVAGLIVSIVALRKSNSAQKNATTANQASARTRQDLTELTAHPGIRSLLSTGGGDETPSAAKERRPP
jgi:hypothetical protein